MCWGEDGGSPPMPCPRSLVTLVPTPKDEGADPHLTASSLGVAVPEAICSTSVCSGQGRGGAPTSFLCTLESVQHVRLCWLGPCLFHAIHGLCKLSLQPACLTYVWIPTSSCPGLISL